jgi:hypothetical protein
VQGALGLAVAAAVESVPLCHSRGRGQGGNAAEHRERGFGLHPLGVVTGRHEELSGDFEPVKSFV